VTEAVVAPTRVIGRVGASQVRAKASVSDASTPFSPAELPVLPAARATFAARTDCGL
jgi:hypothetical protein